MNILRVLQDKLIFIDGFYKKSSQPFAGPKTKIENNEKPYNDNGREPVGDEPPYLQEWMDAEESLNILGLCCLDLVQRSFKEFLSGYVKNSGKKVPKKKKGWFAAYKSFFATEYKLDWEEAPVDIHLLEQLNLARNDISHGEDRNDIYTIGRTLSKNHSLRFPNSLFANEIDRQMWSGSKHATPLRIEVSADKLQQAIQIVDTFCSYIDQQT
jgi:hypothetical protein